MSSDDRPNQRHDVPPVERHAGPVAILLSGGLDSSILLAELLADGNDVQPVYVRTDLVWEPAETQAVAQFLETRQTPDLRPLLTLELPLRDLYGNHWSVTAESTPRAGSPDDAVFLPGRNALLLVKAAVWCQMRGISHLFLGSLGTSPFPDASASYFAQLGTLFPDPAGRPMKIAAPFAHLNKTQVMQRGRNLPLETTFSCLAPVSARHCGGCNKCAERQAAFQAIGRADPTSYVSSIPATTI